MRATEPDHGMLPFGMKLKMPVPGPIPPHCHYVGALSEEATSDPPEVRVVPHADPAVDVEVLAATHTLIYRLLLGMALQLLNGDGPPMRTSGSE